MQNAIKFPIKRFIITLVSCQTFWLHLGLGRLIVIIMQIFIFIFDKIPER